MMKIRKPRLRCASALQRLFGMALAAEMLLSLAACGTIFEELKDWNGARTNEHFERSNTLFHQGNYEEAFQENQKALATGEAPADVALFNMGLISAYSLNPKRNYATALHLFRQVVKDHPQSPLAEQAHVWIQVLEEQQKMTEEKQKLMQEKRILTREKEALAREREQLAQEKEKLKQVVEKSRQIDLEIERLRRKARSR